VAHAPRTPTPACAVAAPAFPEVSTRAGKGLHGERWVTGHDWGIAPAPSPRRYNRGMWTAILFLCLAFVAFVGATVVAVIVIARVSARRGIRDGGTTDAVVTSFVQRRRRRLGLDGEGPSGDGKPTS
jgi:hypothetical protein